MVLAPAAESVALVTNTQRVVRLPVDSVTLLGKDGTENVSPLKPDEKNYHRHLTGINIKLANLALIKEL